MGLLSLYTGVKVLQKSHSGCPSSDSIVTAGCAGLVRLPGVLVADPGVSGGVLAGQRFDFVVRGVPEVYLDLEVGAPGVGRLVRNVAGCHLGVLPGWRFLRL